MDKFSPLLFILAIIPVVLIVLLFEHRKVTRKYAVEKEKIETNYLKFYSDVIAKNYNLENEGDIEIEKSSPKLTKSDEYIEVSSELLKYSFLLNPVRLGVIRILSTYSQYQQSELRKHLGISWGKFTSHINALEKEGIVSSTDEFIDTKPMKMLYLEERGRIQFRELGRILKSLVEPEWN